MVAGICGIGLTGASAVNDLLFADYYRYCRNGADYSSKNVLLIHFEDLIYQYEDRSEKLKTF